MHWHEADPTGPVQVCRGPHATANPHCPLVPQVSRPPDTHRVAFGWQPVVMAFFVSVFPALVFAVIEIIRRGEQALPFGPSLSAGVMITLLAWPAIGPQVQIVFFDPLFLGLMTGAGAVILFITAFALRLVRGT